MKKIKLLFISILILTAYSIKSQTIVKEKSYNLFDKNEKGAKFSLKSIKCTGNELQINAFIQRKGRVDNKKMFKVLKGGYFPAVKLYTLDKNLNKKSITVKNINLNSITGNSAEYRLLADKIYEIGNSNDDLSYEELQKLYPDVLIPKDIKPENTHFFIETERKVKNKIFETKFDILSNSIIKKETGIETVNLEYPETQLIRKKFGYGLANPDKDRFIFVSGLFYDKKARKADPARKWNEYRQYEFNSFDRTGKCLNTYNTDFKYPKTIQYNSAVYTNGKFEGFVYIFGYMPGAKKYNNKETKNKYWAVYFDKNGKHVFTKEFESEYGTIFYTAHKFNNELFLFVQGNNFQYGIIRISESDYKQSNISIQQLEENTVNGTYTSGLKKSFGHAYQNRKVFIADNGTFLVVLENKNTKTVKKGDKTIKINSYRTFAVQFDKDGNFVKQYILLVKNPKSKSFSKRYKLIAVTPDKFVLLFDEAVSGYKAKPYSTFYTASGETVLKDKQKNLIAPVVTVINFSEKKISSSKLSADVFYRLSKNVLFCSDKKTNSIYFAGTNKDRNKLIISEIKY